MTAVEDLLARMSWPEKLAQLQIVWKRDEADALALARAGIGALFWPQSAERTNALQRAAVQDSAHGIPLLIGLDVVHGQFTIFPTPIAQAASFDPSVAVADGRVSASEARSSGVNWTFSPMVDVTRDPRWGRVVEGFGEDAFLVSTFAAAKVRGYQGEDLAAPDSIAACLKHFVAYGAAEAGRDYNATDVSRRRLRDVYLEPFRHGVAAGAASVMASFNSLNGTPMHANRRLLTDVLGEYAFAGLVVGDAEGVAQLAAHGVAADEVDAIRQALSAGVDMVMGGVALAGGGEPVLAPSEVTAERIDDAVLRVLRVKQALGLFDHPYVDEAAERTGPTAASLRAARDGAQRCIVLLKNDRVDSDAPARPGGPLLPIDDQPRRILLTGPYAASTDHLGAWVQHFAAEAGTLDAALRKRLTRVQWSTETGAEFIGHSADAIAAASARARTHDLVVVAVGEPSSLTGEASSRSDIRLPGDQERLIHAIADTGVPFVVMLVTGRPLVVDDWIDRAPAVLLTWHLGSQGPEAIADVIAGDVNPGGRVPMTFPRAVGQIPIHHDHEPTGRPARTGGSLTAERRDVGLEGPNNQDDFFTSKYRDLDLGPRFDFGHGLSYTSFEVRDVSLTPARITLDRLRNGDRVTVTAAVHNVGGLAGDDVVFAYLGDPVASLSQPVQRLRGFARIGVPAGEAVHTAFELGWDDLGFWTEDEEFIVEPGLLTVTVTDGGVAHRLTLEVER